MAIYRIGGYAPSLIQDAPAEPAINSPEAGEPTLLKALQNIEDYSKTLVISHAQLTDELKNRTRKASEISALATANLSKMISNFQDVTTEEIQSFDQFLDDLDSLTQDFSSVDELYNDVLHLSDLLTSIEHGNLIKSSI